MVFIFCFISFVNAEGPVTGRIDDFGLRSSGVTMLVPKIKISGEFYSFTDPFSQVDQLKVLTALISTAMTLDKEVKFYYSDDGNKKKINVIRVLN